MKIIADDSNIAELKLLNEHASEIMLKVNDLNDLMQDAGAAGLEVELELDTYQTIDKAVPLIRARVALGE